MAVPTHTVENLKRNSVLVSDVFYLNALNEQLDLVASTQISTKSPVHSFKVAGGHLA